MAQLTGWGEAAAPAAENWNCSGGAELPTPPSVAASLIPAQPERVASESDLQPQSTTKSGHGLLRKKGLLLPAHHWGTDHFTAVTGKSNYKVLFLQSW